MTSAMPKSLDPDEEILIRNLKKFREDLEMKQEDAAQAADIKVDNLRRWERGETTINVIALKRLAEVYGQTMEAFYMLEPPPPNLEGRPSYLLRTMPGVTDLPPESTARIQQIIDEENRRLAQIRDRKTKKKTPRKDD